MIISLEMAIQSIITGFISSVFTSAIIALFLYLKAHFAVKKIVGKWRFAQQENNDIGKLVSIRHRKGNVVEIETGVKDAHRWKGWIEFSFGWNALNGKGTYKYLGEERWGTLYLLSWVEQPNQLYINGIGYNAEGTVRKFSYELLRSE
jgi:hypothetical protein